MLRQQLVDCWIMQQIQRFHGFRLQTALSQGRQPGPETSIMKLFAAEYLRRLGDTALEMLGPEGMLLDDGSPAAADWQMRFLHAPAIRIAGGSNEVQRNIIGERVLGLPRDLSTDRDVPFRDLSPAVGSVGRRWRIAWMTEPETLTTSQAARRERVIRAALEARVRRAATTPCRCATWRPRPASPSARSTGTSRRRTICWRPRSSSGWTTSSAASGNGRRGAPPPQRGS